MAATSIRHMNITLVAMEHAVDAVLKLEPRSKEPVYYWSVYRKVLRGKGKYGDGWKFVRDYFGTKAQVAELWNKHYRDGNHRLRCQMKY